MIAYVFPAAATSATAAESLHAWLSFGRRVTSTLCAGALGYAGLHHTDVGKKTLSALDELKRMHKQHTEEMQSRLERLEQEAAALRSRESTKLAVQAAVLRKAGRRASSPLHPLSAGKLSSGKQRRHLSPLANSGKRSARSPGSDAGRPSPDGTSMTWAASTDCTAGAAAAGAEAATAATRGGGVGSAGYAVSECSTKPPSPPPSDLGMHEVDAPMGAASGPTSLAALAGDALAAAATAIGATPAAKKARGRRSSVGSTETDALTPTRKSARLANKTASNLTGA